MAMRRARGLLGPTAVGLLPVLVLVTGAVLALSGGCVSSDATGPGDASVPETATSSGDGGSVPDVVSGGDASDGGSDASGGDASDGGSDAGGDADDGGSEDGDADAAACTQDLSNIGTGDFRIAFRIQATAVATVSAVVSQRGACSAGIYWSIRMYPNGTLVVETDNNTERPGGYYNYPGTIAVNDGAPHDVVVTRTSGNLAIRVDGVLDQTDAGATSTSSLGALSILRIGTDVCVGGGGDGTTALNGTVTNVCVGP
jgi:hypothetical protein